MNRRSLAALVGAGALASACFDLDVSAVQPTTGTQYTRAEILEDPELIERVVAGTFVNLWVGMTREQPWTVLSIFGEELTTSTTTFNNDVWLHVQEPRGPLNNSLQDGTSLLSEPWGHFYEANAGAAEFGGIVKRQGIRIIDRATLSDQTARMLAFAKFVSGVSHVYLGLLFDSAAIVNEELDLSKPQVLPLRPYQEVIDSGIKWLEESIEMSTQNSFVFPLNEGQWIYNTGFDNIELRKAAHSYIARAIAYQGRTPEERAAADWARVKQHAAAGITSPFGPMGIPASSSISFLYRRATTSAPTTGSAICGSTSQCSGAGLMRVDTRLVGPADTTGQFQEWLLKVKDERFDTVAPVTIGTPDARIQEAGGTTPAFKPTYFKVTDVYPSLSQMDTTIRGKYYVSFYWNSTRADDNRTQFPGAGGGRNLTSRLDDLQDDMMTPTEMDLLIAEAEFRLGNLAAAAELINKTRVENGELPGVTAAGVPNDPASCAPRRWNGECASLFEALVYEKRIETYGLAIAFFDARGWGCLLEGTITQFPMPATQRDLMGRPVYTYGGNPGTTGSASAPNCPLFHRP